MSFDISEYKRRESTARAKAEAITKPNVFAALAAVGVATVMVSFDGSGDSGQIESVTCEGETDNIDSLKCIIGVVDYSAAPARNEPNPIIQRQVPLQEAIENLCYDILEEAHGGWEINEGAYGEFTIDVIKQHIGLEFNERYESVNTTNEEY